MGLSVAELDELDEGLILDMMTESANDHEAGEYRQLATQDDFDKF